VGEGKARSFSPREMRVPMAEIGRQLGICTSAIGMAMKKQEGKVN